MQVRTTVDRSRLSVRLVLDPAEGLAAHGQVGRPIELLTDSAVLELEDPTPEPHPDLVALSVLTIVAPWVRHRLILDSPISATLAEAVDAALGIEVGPVDEALDARRTGGRLGLMYSGGPDCMAAESLVGEAMPYYHFVRRKHPRMPNRMTHVRVDVTRRLVEQARHRGEEVHVASSDLEYLCRPYATFPQWVAMTIGAILRADADGLGGLVTGRNLSGMYLRWGAGFDPDGDRESVWQRLFTAAGLPLVQPLAGASEVVTKPLAAGHRLADLARSCQLGSDTAPCGRCKKCLNRNLLIAARNRVALPDGWADPFEASGTLPALVGHPPPYEDQFLYEYILPRIPGIASTPLGAMADHLDVDETSTAWLERYYEPALERHVGSDRSATVRSRLTETVAFMSDDDVERLSHWTPEASMVAPRQP